MQPAQHCWAASCLLVGQLYRNPSSFAAVCGARLHGIKSEVEKAIGKISIQIISSPISTSIDLVLFSFFIFFRLETQSRSIDLARFSLNCRQSVLLWAYVASSRAAGRRPLALFWRESGKSTFPCGEEAHPCYAAAPGRAQRENSTGPRILNSEIFSLVVCNFTRKICSII